MKKTIRVFPDYASSGLWSSPPNYANLDESEVAHCIPAHIMIALKYWHRVWEDYAEHWETSGETSITRKYAKQWEQDGIAIVAAMNACQDDFNFVYVGDNF